MRALLPDLGAKAPLRVLCIGAHSDDIEIGCGGTLLDWSVRFARPMHLTWVVLGATAERASEARRSARALMRRCASLHVQVGSARDGYFPAHYESIKDFLVDVRSSMDPHAPPDIVFTHRLEDRHQDHRVTAELTWNLWRDHLVLEYEVAKFEGDLVTPNVYCELPAATMRRKADHLVRHFGSQRGKSWFERENFLALARLRALECRASTGFAEAFHARKLVLSLPVR
jgi:LmbE family N-acetylglucosaminyl deacetylase